MSILDIPRPPWDDENRKLFAAHLMALAKRANEDPDEDRRVDARRSLMCMSLIRDGYGIEPHETDLVLESLRAKAH